MSRWLLERAQEPCYGQKDLSEIEDHLRESVSALQERGLSPEEAFAVARRRLGDGAALDAEFAKVNGRQVWLSRAVWMLVGVQVWMLMSDPGILARVTALWGLLQTGVLWTTASGLYSVSVPLATLTAAIQLSVLAACALAIVWYVRNRTATAARDVKRILGRSSYSALCVAALCGLGLATKFASTYLPGRFYMGMPGGLAPRLAASVAIGQAAINLAQILTVPLVIVLLARREQRRHP